MKYKNDESSSLKECCASNPLVYFNADDSLLSVGMEDMISAITESLYTDSFDETGNVYVGLCDESVYKEPRICRSEVVLNGVVVLDKQQSAKIENASCPVKKVRENIKNYVGNDSVDISALTVSKSEDGLWKLDVIAKVSGPSLKKMALIKFLNEQLLPMCHAGGIGSFAINGDLDFSKFNEAAIIEYVTNKGCNLNSIKFTSKKTSDSFRGTYIVCSYDVLKKGVSSYYWAYSKRTSIYRKGQSIDLIERTNWLGYDIVNACKRLRDKPTSLLEKALVVGILRSIITIEDNDIYTSRDYTPITKCDILVKDKEWTNSDLAHAETKESIEAELCRLESEAVKKLIKLGMRVDDAEVNFDRGMAVVVCEMIINE